MDIFGPRIQIFGVKVQTVDLRIQIFGLRIQAFGFEQLPCPVPLCFACHELSGRFLHNSKYGSYQVQIVSHLVPFLDRSGDALSQQEAPTVAYVSYA